MKKYFFILLVSNICNAEIYYFNCEYLKSEGYFTWKDGVFNINQKLQINKDNKTIYLNNTLYDKKWIEGGTHITAEINEYSLWPPNGFIQFNKFTGEMQIVFEVSTQSHFVNYICKPDNQIPLIP